MVTLERAPTRKARVHAFSRVLQRRLRFRNRVPLALSLRSPERVDQEPTQGLASFTASALGSDRHCDRMFGSLLCSEEGRARAVSSIDMHGLWES